MKNLKLNLDDQQWWSKGVRFQCQGSGKCCVSHGEFGFVYLTPKDRARFAKHLGISTASFTKKYCSKDKSGTWHLNEDPKRPECMFLKNKKCTAYEARPNQCRTWPFWPEVMTPKAWSKEVASFCPGVGKGPKISSEEIRKSIRQQVEWDKDLGK